MAPISAREGRTTVITTKAISRRRVQRRREDVWLLAAAFAMTFVVTLLASFTIA
jgi:hypothetical protein